MIKIYPAHFMVLIKKRVSAVLSEQADLVERVRYLEATIFMLSLLKESFPYLER